MEVGKTQHYVIGQEGVFTLTLRVIGGYPQLLFPLLLCWLVYAPTILYFKYYFPWNHFSFKQGLGIDYLVFTGFSLLLCFSCFIMLEIIRQIETGEPISLILATLRAIPDMRPALPIALVWAAIWLFLTLLEVIFSRFKGKPDGVGLFSLEGAAKTLSGYGSFSLTGTFFAALSKGVRMLVYMVLPAIAWENETTEGALARGLGIAGRHKMEFAKGFALTWVASTLLFLPAGLLIYITDKMHITLPDYVWVLCIIYMGFAWSTSMLIEQLFAALLYLWHLKWLRLKVEALKQKKVLAFDEVPPPSLLDDSERLLED